MENAIVMPSAAPFAWLEKVLPHIPPAMLPVDGRRYVDYLLEACRVHGAKKTEIFDWTLPQGVLAGLQDEDRPGGAVPCLPAAGEPPRNLRELQNDKALAGKIVDGTIVAWGLTATLRKVKPTEFRPCTPQELSDTPIGVYRFDGAAWHKCTNAGMMAITDVKSWYDADLALLHNPDVFSLPGYSSEKDVHLGMNVVMERGTKIAPPVLILDNVWCARCVKLEGDVIIGRGAYVSEGTRLKGTIISSGTFVGKELDLRGKIVFGSRVIDPETGTWTDVEDPYIARNMGKDRTWKPLRIARRILRVLTGTSRGRRTGWGDS